MARSRRGEKIEKLLTRMGQTAPWLARKLSEELGRNVPKQSVYQYIEGASPRDGSILPAIAKILGVRVELLEDDRLDLPEEEPLLAKKREAMTRDEELALWGDVAIPVWAGVSCGTEDDECFQEEEVRFEQVQAFYVAGKPENHVMCIPRGYSMAPRILRADRVVVRLDPDVPVGRLVVARSPNNQNFIKKLVKQNGFREELHSLNAEFPPITDLDGWSIKGGVVAIMHPYEGTGSNIEYDGGAYLRA